MCKAVKKQERRVCLCYGGLFSDMYNVGLAAAQPQGFKHPRAMTDYPKSLNRNHLFARAYRSKLCFVSPFVVTYVVKKRRGDMFVGITASKKIGGAVERNRARRVVKAAAFEMLRGINESYNIVFVCRKAILSKKSTFIKKIINEHLVKAGVIRNPKG